MGYDYGVGNVVVFCSVVKVSFMVVVGVGGYVFGGFVVWEIEDCVSCFVCFECFSFLEVFIFEE